MLKTAASVFLLIHFFTLLLSPCTCQAEFNQAFYEEQAVLLRLKQHWKNPQALHQWLPSIFSSHCDWPGVFCVNFSVTCLNLRDMGITGMIPPFICELRNLQVVDFGNNSIIGTFPLAFYNCSKLEHLDISQNFFVGAIPDDIDRLSRLSFLNVSGNNFTGDIPPAIGKLHRLKSLQLHQNQFNGTFPIEIGNLFNLEELMLSYNDFLPSRFPPNFTQLKKVKQLWFTQSNLIGEVPQMIGEMVALEVFDLSRNNLTGNIPSSLFTLKNLRKLYLYMNKLSGEIPDVVDALNLVELDLSENNLTGTIPHDFGKLEKLSTLNLFLNRLSGEIPASVGRLPALSRFNLFSNNLSGAIPSELGLHSVLLEFQVSSNKLTGRLPESLCNGGKLIGIVAYDNKLRGEFPKSLANCSSLTVVRVERNAFSGSIPDGLWTSVYLQQLMLSDNLFTGELPNEVSENLLLLKISNNRFSGKLPVGISWRNLVVLNASNNLFSGTVPQELTALPHLTALLLDRNQLTGALPSHISSWKSLDTINMRRNQLSGKIPDAIATLPNLNELDFSENQFSGEIPPQLGSLKLTFLNLSSNNLTGGIPRQFENSAYSSSFLNNPGLCTSTSFLNLHVCNPRPRRSRKNSTRLIALISSVFVSSFLLVVFISLFVIRVYPKNGRLNSTWNLTPFLELDFTESDILSGLTESNLIGSGRSGKVYRVHIKGSGRMVAVKIIRNDRELDHNLEKEFQAEVEILSTVRHLNIVKLLCCISNGNSKLLVYEYMENGSLDQWLHAKKRPRNLLDSVCQADLKWPIRFRIAVGAARGLSYMHHYCSPPIIHRDVKSSNILLNSEFHAKIADFGLARMLIKKGKATVSTVAGSFGYMAPEYAHTAKVNEKTDVYSFGVVLLELTTGKEANFGDENTCLADWSWCHMNKGNPIENLLDEEIKEPCNLDQMSTVFKLGIKCTSKIPSDRPPTREVLQILLQCNHPPVYEVNNMEREIDKADSLLEF